MTEKDKGLPGISVGLLFLEAKHQRQGIAVKYLLLGAALLWAAYGASEL
jgi:GNAT superfamily N-acetyltransferase